MPVPPTPPGLLLAAQTLQSLMIRAGEAGVSPSERNIRSVKPFTELDIISNENKEP